MNTKKTIIYIGGFELPDKNAAAQRVLSNAKIFRDLGFNVVLVGVDKSLSIDTDINKTKSTVQGFETFAISYPSSSKAWLKYITTIGYIDFLLENTYNNNIYAIVAYNYPAIALYKLNNICKQKEIFLISDITEWYGSSGGNILFNTVKWLDTALRMYYVHSKMDGLITISKYLSEFYKNKNSNIVEIPTLFDIQNLNYINNQQDRGKKVKLMYAGSAFNLERVDKNRRTIKDRLDKIIALLYSVYEKKKNFILDIYGLSKENYLGVFPEDKDILHVLQNHIIFHGRKSHREIVENIQKSDFTIFIRNIDRVIEAGFPTKFSESISYGTPVITNKINNIVPYVIEEKNGFFIGLDDETKSISQMIKILDTKEEDKKKMKQYCLTHKTFDFRNYVDSMSNFLKNIKRI